MSTSEAINLLLSVNPTGYVYNDGYYKLAETLELNDGERMTEITICMWLYPTRYLKDSQIFSVSRDERFGEPVLSIRLQLGLLSIDGTTFSKYGQILLREWTHMCVLKDILGIVKIFYDNVLHDLIGAPKPFDADNIHLVVGAHNENEPYSGLIADLRVYKKALDVDRMKKISKVEKTFDDYVLVGNFTFGQKKLSEFQYPYNLARTLAVEAYGISSGALRQSNQNIYLKIEENLSCYGARSVCSTFGGRLPKANEINDERIRKLEINFWVSQSEDQDKTCVRIMADKKGNFTDNCSSTSDATFVCVIPKHQKYYFKLTESLKYEFFILPFTNIVFETNDSFRLTFEGKDGYLKNLRTEEPVLEAHNIKTQTSIIGRHEWREMNNYFEDSLSNRTYRAVFSVCTINEYTCTNGMCISMHLVCDFDEDCPDASDEEFCECGMEPEGFYDKRHAPTSNLEEKASVSLVLSLQRVIDVLMDNNVVELSLAVEVTWKDERLSFKNIHLDAPHTIGLNMANLYWHPTIYIKPTTSTDREVFQLDLFPGVLTAISSTTGLVQVIKGYEAFYIAGEDVNLTHSKSSDVHILCSMNLFLYPFDKQRCSFTMQLVGRVHSDAVWNTDSQAKLIDEQGLALFENMKFRVAYVSDTELEFTFSFTRKFGAYLFNTFLPCVILEIIGLMSLLLPSEDYNDRIQVTLSCLIVMAALFTQVSTSLPTSAEPKMIDIWLFVHVFILFMMFAVDVVVIGLHYRFFTTQEDKCKGNVITPWINDKKPQMSKTLMGVSGINFRPNVAKNPLYEKVNAIGLILSSVLYLLFLGVFFYRILRDRY